MIDRFFGADAEARVADAVREAEARSIGQIVPVVVERSALYTEARYRGGIAAAVVATAVVLAARLPLTLAELPLVQLAAGIAGALAASLAPIERLLTGHRELDEAARQRAFRAFHEHGLARTQHGTGVLVFASLRERRAVVLGDHGIHAKMGDAEWQRAVDVLVAGMGRGDPAAGFREAIGICGAKLAEHFPRTGAGPGNELPDTLHRSRT